MLIRSLLAALLLFATFHAQAANPQVSLRTNLGEMIVELYPDKAPKTVENFLHYVKSGFYKGTIFHRVVQNFVIQGGGYTPDYQHKDTFAPIPIEANNGLSNDAGTLAMARADDPNSATSQFYINLTRNLHLNFYKPDPDYYGYTVFGKVVKGMDVAKKIGTIPTTNGGPFPADVPKEQIVIEDAALVEPQQAEASPAPQKAANKPARKKTADKPTHKKDVEHG